MSIIKGIESRLYQETLFMEAKDQNSLIVLPTGLGKTIIILYLVGHFYKSHPQKKIIVATPTKPLVHQIAKTFEEYLDINQELIIEIDGSTAPDKRKILYETGKIFIGTPQTFSNDFDTDKLIPKDFSLLCFDEAHRSTGNYAYVKIVQNFFDFNLNPRIIGFTATPGNKPEQIEKIIQNLHIEAICSRFPEDPDVKPFISSHKPKLIWLQLPESYKIVNKFLDSYQTELLDEIKSRGMDPGKYINKNTALDLQRQVTARMHDEPEIGELLFFVPNLIRILHIREIVETQGLPQANNTFSNWFLNPKQKTLKMFVEHPFIRNAYETITKNPEEHPKLLKLVEILQERIKDKESKIIVFSNFRDTVDYLLKELEKHNIVAKKFVGQSSQKKNAGMSQKEQINVLNEFKEGDLNIIISTSVGEEGIDVGACDLVIFYDSVPSVVRNVQRIGRGRKRESEVIKLITKDTKDAAMYYATIKQEKKIQYFIRNELQSKLKIPVKINKVTKTVIAEINNPEKVKQETKANIMNYINFDDKPSNKKNSTEQKTGTTILKTNSTEENNSEEENFPKIQDKYVILVDNREARSQVPRLLKKDKDTKIQLLNLPEGDYKVSAECVIERKTMHDLAESIIDGRLFDQIGNKLNTYKKPILIIEGSEKEIKINISPNAIKGALATIILSFNIPILHTIDEEETAGMILAFAKREQRSEKYKPNFHTISKSYPMKEIQRFLLSSIPGVNRAKADQLLEEFKTIQKLCNADPSELIILPGIGKTLTERVLRILQDKADDTEHIE